MKNFIQSKMFRFLFTAAIGGVIYMICPPCLSKTALISILGILFILVNASEYIAKVPVITHIARILVGGLFVFSGFIKANDPLGFSYKLKEYFEVFEGDTGWKFFEAFAEISLPLAIIICASEIVLGVMLLIGFKKNLTLWLLLAQIVFFTFLTFYSACYNKVTHCGCFGDFLKLTPWSSFWKDIALLILITLLFSGRENIQPLMGPMLVNSLFIIGLLFSIVFPIYAYRNLPPLDFRAYAPGMNIRDNMKPGPNFKPDSTVILLRYKNLKTGELRDFDNGEYVKLKIWEDTLTWKWDTTITKVVREMVDGPKITDFSVNDLEGNNITDSILNNHNYSFWLIMHELEKTNQNSELMAKVNDFYRLANEDHYQFIAMTSSGREVIDKFKHEHNALYDFAAVDNTVLKTMIRSNPGLMLVKNGTVIANWHYNNFPVYSQVKQELMK